MIARKAKAPRARGASSNPPKVSMGPIIDERV